MQWTRMVLLTRGPEADVRSRVVLTPRRWCQVCEKERRRRWPTSPEHRGEHDIAVKTIAWGMPGDSGVTCMLVCALPLPLHTRPRAHRAPGIPCALNSERAGISEHLAKKPFGEIAKPCLAVIMSGRHCEPTGSANARPVGSQYRLLVGRDIARPAPRHFDRYRNQFPGTPINVVRPVARF